ncbi:hypothetical protein PO124_11755 [Bacillus licheniformis]|nr:hypothetical protein [Bacillus licheniformis]
MSRKPDLLGRSSRGIFAAFREAEETLDGFQLKQKDETETSGRFRQASAYIN